MYVLIYDKSALADQKFPAIVRNEIHWGLKDDLMQHARTIPSSTLPDKFGESANKRGQKN